MLVDDDGRAIGTMPKPEVHHGETPLHRAFSAYLFDDDGRLLVTRRAEDKATFPGMWTNTVCGHPGPDEDDAAAIARRADFELGLEVADLRPALPDYRYRAEFRGVVENEICPVYVWAASPADRCPTPPRWGSGSCWTGRRSAVGRRPRATRGRPGAGSRRG